MAFSLRDPPALTCLSRLGLHCDGCSSTRTLCARPPSFAKICYTTFAAILHILPVHHSHTHVDVIKCFCPTVNSVNNRRGGWGGDYKKGPGKRPDLKNDLSCVISDSGRQINHNLKRKSCPTISPTPFFFRDFLSLWGTSSKNLTRFCIVFPQVIYVEIKATQKMNMCGRMVFTVERFQ